MPQPQQSPPPLQNLWNRFPHIKWRKLKPGERVFFALTSVAIGGIGLAKYWLPGEFPLDANLTASEVSFDYVGSGDRTFLHAFDSPRLAIAGQYSDGIKLQGKFSSPNPKQQKQLAKLGSNASLTLKLPRPDSQLEFRAGKGRSLSFQSLALQPQTQIKSLAYQPPNKPKPAQLSLKIGDCPSPANKTCELRFFPGSKPIEINGAGVAIAELPNLKTPQITFTPAINGEIILSLTPTSKRPLTLNLDLPKTSPTPFSGDLDIAQVKFQRRDRRGRNAADNYRQSTLVSGTARLQEKTLKLEANQYLTLNKNSPGIQRIESLQISQKPPGLQLFVSGQAEALSAGLNPNLPTQTISAKWLDFLPNEVTTGLIGALAGIWGTLFSRLFEDD